MKAETADHWRRPALPLPMLSRLQLSLREDLETMVASQGIAVLSITFPHLTRLADLPRLHRDPFDRMMIAQALAEGIPIATSNRVFASYGLQIVW